jgi:adenylylsulfate kinase
MIPRFIEVAVECPIAVCMQRDRKGTYDKGLRGESSTVPGLQTPYEAPANPELRIDTTKVSAEEAAKQICDMVRARLA